MLLETFYVFSLYVIAEQSVAATNDSPPVPLQSTTTRTAPDTHTPPPPSRDHQLVNHL